MSESRLEIESWSKAGGQLDGDKETEKHRPRWLIGLVIASIVLVIVAVGAYFIFGRELLQRPFLIVAVLVAWLGALVGITIGSDPG